MALSRTQSQHTYTSSSGGQTYTFDIVLDAQNVIGVQNIRSPNGLIMDRTTQVPQTVLQDIDAAIEIVQTQQGETEVHSGTIQFTGQTSKAVAIPGGTLNNTSYRVAYTPPDAVVFRTTGKTITGFTAETTTTYGSVGTPKDVGFSVFVSTAASSPTSGTLSFAFADSGSKAVVFATAQKTANYRVVLTPSGFFPARVVSKTKSGFTVEIGHSLQNNGETVTVGYEVFA